MFCYYKSLGHGEEEERESRLRGFWEICKLICEDPLHLRSVLSGLARNRTWVWSFGNSYTIHCTTRPLLKRFSLRRFQKVKKSKYPILTVTNIRKRPNQQINDSTNQLPVTSQNPAHLFQIFSRQLPAKLSQRIFLLQSTHSGPMRAQPISKNLTPKK